MVTTSKAQLTADGPTLSRIIPGLMRLREWNLSDAELLDWIKACMEMGITTFDHADIYGSYTCEGVFGQALALEPSLRQQMQIVTKCGIKLLSENRPSHRVQHYNTSRESIVQAAENSLEQFGTDYLDVLLVHRPSPLMDADEIAEAFRALKQGGKVLHFGVSNFNPSQFELLRSRLDLPLVTNQLEYSVMQMQPMHDDNFDYLQRLRVKPMIWSPLGGGGIFRKDTEQTQRLNHIMSDVAEALGGVRLDQVALAWTMRHPVGVLPVLGTGKLERIKAAVEAESIELDRQQWFAIWEASAGHPVP